MVSSPILPPSNPLVDLYLISPFEATFLPKTISYLLVQTPPYRACTAPRWFFFLSSWHTVQFHSFFSVLIIKLARGERSRSYQWSRSQDTYPHLLPPGQPVNLPYMAKFRPACQIWNPSLVPGITIRPVAPPPRHWSDCWSISVCLTNVLLMLLFWIPVSWQVSLPHMELTPSGAVSQPCPPCIDPESKAHYERAVWGWSRDRNPFLRNTVRTNWIMKYVKPHPAQGIRSMLTPMCVGRGTTSTPCLAMSNEDYPKGNRQSSHGSSATSGHRQ